jgi:Leucine-rich repeat (LRR) protein
LRDVACAQQFAAWLRSRGSTLQHLSVSGRQLPDSNQLSQKSMRDLAGVLDSISSCKSLTSLQLVCWRGPTSLNEQLLTQLTSLSVRCNHGQTFDYDQLYRSERQQLIALDLHGTMSSEAMDEAEVHQLLRALPNLTSLDLTNICVRLEHLAFYPSLPPLQDLKLGMTDWEDSTLAALAVLPCTSLHAPCGFSRGLDARWSRLAEVAGQLKHLALTCHPAAVTKLALLTVITQLTSLQFEYCLGFNADADVVTPLAALPNLRQLTVAGLSKDQGDALSAAVAVARFPRLKELILAVSWRDLVRGCSKCVHDHINYEIDSFSTR